MPVDAATRSAGGRRTRAGSSRSTACGSAGRCAARAAATRSPSTPRSPTSSTACADPRATARLDHARDTAPPTLGCTSWAGRTASRSGTATARWSAGCTALGVGGLFAGESMFHRAHATPRRSRWSRSSSCCATTAPGVACSTCSGRPPHLATLGAVEVAATEYLERLAVALATPAFRLTRRFAEPHRDGVPAFARVRRGAFTGAARRSARFSAVAWTRSTCVGQRRRWTRYGRLGGHDREGVGETARGRACGTRRRRRRRGRVVGEQLDQRRRRAGRRRPGERR